jgi:hypothetical protein
MGRAWSAWELRWRDPSGDASVCCQQHDLIGMCRPSLALSPLPAIPNVTRWPLPVEYLARTATWDAPVDCEQEVMGRRCLSLPLLHELCSPPAQRAHPASPERCPSAHRVEWSLRRMVCGLCQCLPRTGPPAIRCRPRLRAPFCALPRCATNKQGQRLSRHGARPRSPAPVAHIPAWGAAQRASRIYLNVRPVVSCPVVCGVGWDL